MSIQITDDMQLRVQAWCVAAARVFQVRALVKRPSGEIVPINREFRTVTAVTLLTSNMDLPDGELLSLQCRVVTAGVLRGFLFVNIALLVRGIGVADEYQLLVQGYLITGQYLSWPLSPMCDSWQGPGVPVQLAPAAPAAGANLAYDVPAGYLFRWLAIRFMLITDNNAAARRVSIVPFGEGGDVFTEWSVFTQAASLTYQYMFIVGADSVQNGTFIREPLVNSLIIPGGANFSINVANIQVGDQIQTVRLTMERLLVTP